MRVLGLQGSPRRKGNASLLLAAYMAEAKRLGALTHTVDVERHHVLPCKEYIVCEKKGYCPIDDDMQHFLYGRIRWADIIVMASPVFFFNVTAQLKALIDRCQVFWARKYRLKLTDPGAGTRQGCLLAVGASRGKKLFDGVELTAKYFFDAVDARYAERLMYRGVESFKDIERHPTAIEDAKMCAARMVAPFLNRKRILFLSRQNACRTQMAAAFARREAGDRLEICTGGTAPALQIAPAAVSAMAEVGIDCAFLVPPGHNEALAEGFPDVVVSMDGTVLPPGGPPARVEVWRVAEVVHSVVTDVRAVRDDIENRVKRLVGSV